MQLTLKDIRRKLGGDIEGNGDVTVAGVADLEGAGADLICFAESAKLVEKVRESEAGAFIVGPDFPHLEDRNLLRIDNPRFAFIRLMRFFERKPATIAGIHPSAVIATYGVELGRDVSVAEHVVIRGNTRIGRGTQIESGTHIGEGVKIGERCHIGPNVVLNHDIVIGDRVTIQACSVIGGDGFGYIWADNAHMKIPQLGTVWIDDDVEIGCNVCVDRATFGTTRIRRGTKIDNLVQIGHNNDIGEHCIIISQVGLSGSVTLGRRVTLAGQVGVADHLRIGDGAIVGAASGVSKDIKPKEIVWGLPAQARKKTLKELASLARLPDLMRQLKEFSARLTRLERRLGGD